MSSLQDPINSGNEEAETPRADEDDHDSSSPSATISKMVGKVQIKSEIDRCQRKLAKARKTLDEVQKKKDQGLNNYMGLISSTADGRKITTSEKASKKDAFEKENKKLSKLMAHWELKVEHYKRKLKDLEDKRMEQSLENLDVISSASSRGMPFFAKGGSLPPKMFASKKASSRPLPKIPSIGLHKDTSSSSMSNILSAAGDGDTKLERTQSPLSVCSDEDAVSVSSVESEKIGMGGLQIGATSRQIDKLESQVHEHRDILEKFMIQSDKTNKDVIAQVRKLESFMSQVDDKLSSVETQFMEVLAKRKKDEEAYRLQLEQARERISYQTAERTRDLKEALDKLETRLSTMDEKQRRDKEQVSIEHFQNDSTKQIVFLSVNVVLQILQVILAVFSGCAGFISQGLQSKTSFFITLLIVCAVAILGVSIQSGNITSPWDFISGYVFFTLYGVNETAKPS